MAIPSRPMYDLFSITVGKYEILCNPVALPEDYERQHRSRALLIEENLEEKSPYQHKVCFVSVRNLRDHRQSLLVVAQSYEPAGSINPSVLIIEETDILFVGVGEVIFAYNLSLPHRLWIDSSDTGFHGWHRFGDIVVMSAELELAAWTVQGEKLWSMYVEPPYDFRVEGDTMHVDRMGELLEFNIGIGPEKWRNG